MLRLCGAAIVLALVQSDEVASVEEAVTEEEVPHIAAHHARIDRISGDGDGLVSVPELQSYLYATFTNYSARAIGHKAGVAQAFGIEDGDGYVHFFGRDDDVITSAGYRIGPGEIEDCLTGHPSVALAAVVGKPDPLRTEIVKAYVVLKEGVERNEELAGDISLWVRERLSAHEYPREVEFVDSMPLTTTGKVIRRIFRDRAKAEAS